MAGEELDHIKNRLRCHSPVYPMKSGQDLSQKLTKTTDHWTEQQEAEEELSMGNKGQSFTHENYLFTVTKRERETGESNHLPTCLLLHGHVLKSVC